MTFSHLVPGPYAMLILRVEDFEILLCYKKGFLECWYELLLEANSDSVAIPVSLWTLSSVSMLLASSDVLFKGDPSSLAKAKALRETILEAKQAVLSRELILGTPVLSPRRIN